MSAVMTPEREVSPAARARPRDFRSVPGTTPELRDQCKGRWPSIMSAMGFDERFVRGKHGPCEMCQDGKDCRRFTNYADAGRVICSKCAPGSVDGVEFLMIARNWDFATAAREIRGVLGETTVAPIRQVDPERRRARMNAVWAEAAPLAKGDATVRYLRARGLTLPLSTLQDVRTHEAMPYWHDGEVIGRYPAMVALVRDADGSPSTLHVTWLDGQGGKADVPVVRKLQTPAAPWTGGAVRLRPMSDERTVLIAEGLETVLALHEYTHQRGAPWAALNAGNLERFVPPAGCERVVIGADKDRPSFTGESAAYAAAKRISATGVTVEVLVPDDPGDWCDALRDMRGQVAA